MSPPLVFLAAAAFAGWAAVGYIAYLHRAPVRNQILPDTLGKVPRVSHAVAGDTAWLYDKVHALHSSLPAAFAFVAALAFVLLLVAFWSVTVSLVSIVLNLLSVGAAYGVVTLIFQDGRLQGPLDYTAFGGIIYWVPLMMFVFLFGISMDYHVFILSRVRELGHAGRPRRRQSSAASPPERGS